MLLKDRQVLQLANANYQSEKGMTLVSAEAAYMDLSLCEVLVSDALSNVHPLIPIGP